MGSTREATSPPLGTVPSLRLWPASERFGIHRAGHESVGPAPHARRPRITNEVPGWIAVKGA
jgi:hypothetical protein